MLKNINNFLVAQPPWRLVILLFLLLIAVGAIDAISGFELSFSIFYTVPVGIGSWYLGRRLGFTVCVISALIWFAADYVSGHEYSNALIPLWNTSVRLGYFIIISYLLDRLSESLKSQVALAQIDGLTSLLNARTFKQRCHSIFDLTSRHHRPLALGYLDLDNFKGINDNLGHSVGDQVLKATASVLGKRLRASDLGGRLGGDEFAILLPDTDLAGARMFFNELHTNLIDLANDNAWPIGFSIGVAVFHTPVVSPDAAISFADNLMYKVKKSGKNNILFEEYTQQ